MDKLITSSRKTLGWLNEIISGVVERIPHLEYKETKYWAALKSQRTNRNVAFLQPQKNQIRLLSKLNLNHDNALLPTPSTGNWAQEYHSLFVIKSKEMIEKAIELIVSSYEHDLTL